MTAMCRLGDGRVTHQKSAIVEKSVDILWKTYAFCKISLIFNGFSLVENFGEILWKTVISCDKNKHSTNGEKNFVNVRKTRSYSKIFCLTNQQNVYIIWEKE